VLRRLRLRDPTHVIDILGEQRIYARIGPRRIESLLVRVPWLGSAKELHLVETGDGVARFVVVEEFVRARSGPGAPRQDIRGRLLSVREDEELAQTCLRHLLRWTWREPGQRITVPVVDVNDGDLVLDDGALCLTACGGELRGLPLAALPYALLLQFARDPRGERRLSPFYHRLEASVVWLARELAESAELGGSVLELAADLPDAAFDDLRFALGVQDPGPFLRAKAAINAALSDERLGRSTGR
jgi:hypothetical protein